MTNDIKNFFDLEGLILDRTESDDDRLLIKVRSPRNQAECPYCGESTGKVHQHRCREVVHGWHFGKTIKLKVKVRRFKCKQCGKTFTEVIPGVSNSHYTERAKLQALRELKDSSFNRVQNKLGISSSTLTRFMRELTDPREIMWPERGEIHLGLDGHSFSGMEMVITVTEVKRHRLLTILPNDRKSTLIRFLKSLDDGIKSRIKVVCTDMDSGLYNAVRETLPQAEMVIDKYHVLREGTSALDDVRLAIQSLTKRELGKIPKRLLIKPGERLSDEEKRKLELLWDKYQDYSLKKAWIAKEKLRGVYRSSDRKIASHKLNKLIESLKGELGRLGQFRRTLRRWEDSILNYFDTGVTNAYTEGIHTRIKMIKRRSFGFRNVYNYISKIMLSCLPLFWLLQFHQL